MRDQDLINRFHDIEGMASSDIRNLQRQILLIRTRIDAIERVLFASRFGLIKAICIQLFSPRTLARAVQYTHSDQIKKMNEAINEAGKDKPAIKPMPITLAVPK